MDRIKRLLKKVDKIIENIDVQDVINKMQADTEEEFYLQQNEMNVSYKTEDEKYKMTSKNKYKDYECYNDYEVEDEIWTSLRAS